MLRIFLVEDDEAIARNLIRLLSAEGFNVTHALTRGEAHQILAGSQFDLALVDISLPDGNGFAVCTEIKENEDIPVIFLTASDDEASVVTGFRMGADDYVIKPFRPREPGSGRLCGKTGAPARPLKSMGSPWTRPAVL